MYHLFVKTKYIVEDGLLCVFRRKRGRRRGDCKTSSKKTYLLLWKISILLYIETREMEYQGHCMKCKKKVKIMEPAIKTMKNGANMACGKCADCKATTVCTIIAKKK